MTFLDVRELRVRVGATEIVSIDRLTLARGRRLAVVGESGSGKTMTAMSLVGLQASDASVSGSVCLDGQQLVGLGERSLAKIRGRDVGVVFQDPLRSLNPTMRVGRQIEDALRLQESLTRRERRPRVRDLLDRVRLPDPDGIARRYPHELSGGQRQRVLIAGAIACNPSLLIADEPTTALDVTVQERILDLLRDLSDSANMSLLMVSHNLGVVKSLCHEIAVMYGGTVVESGPIADVLSRPRHRYTKALIDANPRFDPSRALHERDALRAIPGTVPAAGHFPSGCPFRGRCDGELPECAQMPRPTTQSPDHVYRCCNPVAAKHQPAQPQLAT